MSIYKRKEIWWIQYTDPNGQRVQRSAGTTNRKEAQELHDKLKAEAWRVKNLGVKPGYIWQEAVIRWLSEQNHKKSIETDKVHLRWLDAHLKNIRLDSITKDVIDKLRQLKLDEGVSNSTVNRVLSLLRSILNRAKDEWEWIDIVPKVRMLKEPLSRVRWLTSDEERRLFAELPSHLLPLVRFALATGLREANVTGLKWSQVDRARHCAWVNADDTKASTAIPIPLNQVAFNIIDQQLGLHSDKVFTYI